MIFRVLWLVAIGKQNLINCHKALFIVYKQFDHILFVYVSKIRNFHFFLGELSQLAEWIIELFFGKWISFKLLKPLVIVNFAFEFPLHYLSFDFFNWLYEQDLHLVFLVCNIGILRFYFSVSNLRLFYWKFKLSDDLTVTCFYELNVLYNFILEVCLSLILTEGSIKVILKLLINGYLLALRKFALPDWWAQCADIMIPGKLEGCLLRKNCVHVRKLGLLRRIIVPPNFVLLVCFHTRMLRDDVAVVIWF